MGYASARMVLPWLLLASVPALGQGGTNVATSRATIQWRHPGGLVTEETVAEVRVKLAGQEWARRTYSERKATLDRWLAVPSETLARVFPRKRGNVYHNFSCPGDRSRLTFDPFTPEAFKCPTCGKTYPPETNAGIYGRGDRYHGTMYDGWACLFYEEAGSVAADMGLVARIEKEGEGRYFKRGIEILMLYAGTIEPLKTKVDRDPQMSVLLTYHREGDNKVLFDLACAYELLREWMTPEQRVRFERVVLQRMLADTLLEPIWRYDHNNLYQWHRTLVQTAVALERDDLIDWSFGYGAFDREHQPEHRSIRRLVATHFKPDGAYWEMCSGYHLYPLHFFCELAVVSHNLSRMDPARFPADRYDLTSPACPEGRAITNALAWFMSMAMPDRTMPTIGDSMAPRAGMDDYYTTAEVGYRFFGLKAVGDYERFRKGQRTWAGLLYGAPEIVQDPTPYTSSYLSSGWVSLRNEWGGNKVWIGLNALIPGGGHQHADRLTLLSYSQGKLLALEKATPYNEAVTRELGTFSQSHNTVTVDKQSQKQGEALNGEQIPKVALFFAGPVVKFAELRGDRIYPQTNVYRRSVALIEDVCVDLFRVEGGSTHDWIVNHGGTAPRFSMTMEEGTFAPAEWLYNGTIHVRHATAEGVWEARWAVDDVTSRLTMLGASGTDVYALETYPVDNAVITPKNPPCQTLSVRRRNDAPFLAVWDSWRDKPNLKGVSRGDRGEAVCLKTASHVYYVLFGPGETRFENDVSMKSDAAFAVVHAGASAVQGEEQAERERRVSRSPTPKGWGTHAITFVRGTRLEVQTPQGGLVVATQQPSSVSAEYADGAVTIETAGDIRYETRGGVDVPLPARTVGVTFDGELWRARERR